MTWLALGLFAKRIGAAVITWLSHRSFWQLVCIALCALLVVQHFQLLDARHDAVNYSRQRDEMKARLDAISTAKNVQRQVTRDRIVTVEKVVRDADGKAKIIEAAPLPGNCKSPKEVLDADI